MKKILLLICVSASLYAVWELKPVSESKAYLYNKDSGVVYICSDKMLFMYKGKIKTAEGDNCKRVSFNHIGEKNGKPNFIRGNKPY